MNYSKLALCRGVFLSLLLALSMGGAACSKHDAPVTVTLDAFKSASPELQAKWKAAADCAAKDDFNGAMPNFVDLYSHASEMTPEQNDALNQAWEALGNRAFKLADSGDKAATDAVLKMRDLKLGEQRRGR